MSESLRSPLARLVLFMVCLSVAGAFIAGAHYVAVDLPQQQNLQAPTNGCQYPFGTLRTQECYLYYCADA